MRFFYTFVTLKNLRLHSSLPFCICGTPAHATDVVTQAPRREIPVMPLPYRSLHLTWTRSPSLTCGTHMSVSSSTSSTFMAGACRSGAAPCHPHLSCVRCPPPQDKCSSSPMRLEQAVASPGRRVPWARRPLAASTVAAGAGGRALCGPPRPAPSQSALGAGGRRDQHPPQSTHGVGGRHDRYPRGWQVLLAGRRFLPGRS